MKRGAPLQRTGRLRHRSRKTETLYRTVRRPLVARLLDERPICERCHAARSVDVHERLSRARGGSIVDEANCAALCRGCHDLITGSPSLAESEGWSVSQYGGDAA